MITHEAQAAFSLFENFEALTLGNINGQNGWVGNSAGTAPNQVPTGNVTADPANPENLVLSITTTSATVYRNFGALSIGNQTATLFFRMRRENTDANISLGTSHQLTPTTNFDDYKTQINTNTASAALNARDGGAFDSVDIFGADTWLNVWMVIDNQKDLYSVYLQGGAYAVPTLLDGADAETLFSFRGTGGDGQNSNTAPAALDLVSFLVKTGGSSATNTGHTGPVYLDDIHVDLAGQNLTVPAAVPEPASIALLGLGATALLGRRRRQE